MAFPDTLSDLRIYIDSKQNSGWTTSTPSTDELIQTIPPLSTASATLSQATEANRPFLENNASSNDIIKFPSGGGKALDASVGDLDLGGITGKLTPSFTVGFKLPVFPGTDNFNAIVLANKGNGSSFECGALSGDFTIRIRGNIVKLSDGTTNLALTRETANPNYISFRFNLSTGLGDLIYNGTEYNDLVLDGTSESGTDEPVKVGGRTASNLTLHGTELEYLVASQSFEDLSTLRDLDSFLRDSLVQLAVTVKNKETDAAIEGAVVKFFEMDAFTADGMDETSVFQNVAQLDGVYVTNASGVATYTGATAFDDTKVQFAMALDSTYDTDEWKFAGWCHVATDNITKTAPA